MMNEDV